MLHVPHGVMGIRYSLSADIYPRYREVRSLSDNNAAASPYLAGALELWGLRVDLERRIIALGNDAVGSYCAHWVGPMESWQMMPGLG